MKYTNNTIISAFKRHLANKKHEFREVLWYAFDYTDTNGTHYTCALDGYHIARFKGTIDGIDMLTDEIGKPIPIARLFDTSYEHTIELPPHEYVKAYIKAAKELGIRKDYALRVHDENGTAYWFFPKYLDDAMSFTSGARELHVNTPTKPCLLECEYGDSLILPIYVRADSNYPEIAEMLETKARELLDTPTPKKANALHFSTDTNTKEDTTMRKVKPVKNNVTIADIDTPTNERKFYDYILPFEREERSPHDAYTHIDIWHDVSEGIWHVTTVEMSDMERLRSNNNEFEIEEEYRRQDALADAVLVLAPDLTAHAWSLYSCGKLSRHGLFSAIEYDIKHRVDPIICHDKPTANAVFEIELHNTRIQAMTDAVDTFTNMPAVIDTPDVIETEFTDAPTRPMPHKSLAEERPDWMNTRIRGKGWVIDFDEQSQRTMVTIIGDITRKLKKALTDNKFTFAPSTRTYNKKLSWKAYRAALKLADTLRAELG